MDLQAQIAYFLSTDAALPPWLAELSSTELAHLADQLKAEVDRNWWRNPHRSVEIASQIIMIGEHTAHTAIAALGLMAWADSVKLLGRRAEAWQGLERAGDLFQQAGDEVGWARTRIGRLALCVDLQSVGIALHDAAQARAIFQRYAQPEKVMRLDLNTGIVYDLLGQSAQALQSYEQALAIAQALGPAGESHLGLIYNCKGVAHEALGQLQQALAQHQLARDYFAARHEHSAVANADCNIAYIHMAQGAYRAALTLLHQAHTHADQIPLEAAHQQRALVECLLLLNRTAEARTLAHAVVLAYQREGAAYAEALSWLLLATAEAERAAFEPAQAALLHAEQLFAERGATVCVALTQVRRARLALAQGHLDLAAEQAQLASAAFGQAGQPVNHATAQLLHAQALAQTGAITPARALAHTVLTVARQSNLPVLRYDAHRLLGQIATTEGNLIHAVRRYRAATATVARLQRDLTITLRPGFLQNKDAALHDLITLHLQLAQPAAAFAALERAKSQVLLGYLVDRGQLRWVHEDPHSRALIAELDHIRAEHQWFYRLAFEQPADPADQAPVGAVAALSALQEREQRMRTLTEQLYLRGAHAPSTRLPLLDPARLQSLLEPGTLLIEWYIQADQLWAFTLDHHGLQLHTLATEPRQLQAAMEALERNVRAVVRLPATSAAARPLTALAQRICHDLYQQLLAPLASRLAGQQRLLIVPYGGLHYLPWHLLHTGRDYLLAEHEVVVLPAAGLLSQPGPTAAPGARVLAYSWQGRLPQTLAEATLIEQTWGGECFREEQAQRSVLQLPPTQILHIAAHGEYRLDQPDFSYLQLADGQLYTDDLLQHDLAYELVILSACETGRANVAARDELIGLGRGFLYAGAGALVVSRWAVADDWTLSLMHHFYTALQTGVSKIAALQQAQLAVRHSQPNLHPAFWGAFQFVGNPRPLRSGPSIQEDRNG